MTGFDDTDNKFHNLFKNFSASSISRALSSLNTILPLNPEFHAKIAAFNLKRDSKVAAAGAQPLAKATGPSKGLDFSDESDDHTAPSAKRPKNSSNDSAPKQRTPKQRILKQMSLSPTRKQPKRTVQTRKDSQSTRKQIK
jgi:hypothetical protein